MRATLTQPPCCYIIAGPNGSGKTTFATEFLPHQVRCLEFVNPDLIAKGLSPFQSWFLSNVMAGGRSAIPRFTNTSFRRRRMTKRDFTKQATAALKTAVANVMEERRKAGRTVPVWKDGRVQRIKPPAVAAAKNTR